MRLRSVFLLAAACSCTAEPPDQTVGPADGPADPADPIEPADPLPSDPIDEPSVGSDAVGEGEAAPAAEPSHRHLKRMRVAQVRSAMEELSGGIAWATGSRNFWDTYAETLGVADYEYILEDTVEPNIMFQKFLDDAAVHTCERWVVSDAASDTPRFFSAAAADQTDPASVTANLLAQRVLIHGRVNEADDPIIDGYREVFTMVLRRTDDPMAAWKTVCVGFFTHPDFFTY